MSDLVLSRTQGSVGRLTLNRPEQRNAMSPDMMRLLNAKLRAMDEDAAIRCIVLDGAGEHFVAGGDIKAWGRLVEWSADERGRDFRDRLEAAYPVIETLNGLSKPLIVAVRGYAVGAGIGFVLAADFVIATQTAKLLFANIRAALNPDMGVTYWLPRRVGERMAYRLALLGREIGAAEACSVGLVDEVVAPEALEEAVAALTRQICATPVRAAAETRRLIRDSRGNSLAQQFSAEVDGVAVCAGEADFLEAVTAFAERRAPKFGQ